jgi:hypothetical protein
LTQGRATRLVSLASSASDGGAYAGRSSSARERPLIRECMSLFSFCSYFCY